MSRKNPWLRKKNLPLMSRKRRRKTTTKKSNTCHTRRKISPLKSRAMRVTNKITTKKTTWLGLIMMTMETVVRPRLTSKKMNSLGSWKMCLNICFKMMSKHKKRCPKSKRRRLFMKRSKNCLMVILKRSKNLMKSTSKSSKTS